MAPTTQTTQSLLGKMVTERLRQLGISRRAFCIQNNVSRQTLYEIEYKGKVNLLTSTLVAIDNGCRWEPGTALKYAMGDADARSNSTVEERVDNYIGRILNHISLLTVDELEREAIWLEEELFGRQSSSHDESVKLIREAMSRLIPRDVRG